MPVFMREHMNGMYRVDTYFFSKQVNTYMCTMCTMCTICTTCTTYIQGGHILFSQSRQVYFF